MHTPAHRWVRWICGVLQRRSNEKRHTKATQQGLLQCLAHAVARLYLACTAADLLLLQISLDASATHGLTTAKGAIPSHSCLPCVLHAVVFNLACRCGRVGALVQHVGSQVNAANSSIRALVQRVGDQVDINLGGVLLAPLELDDTLRALAAWI